MVPNSVCQFAEKWQKSLHPKVMVIPTKSQSDDRDYKVITLDNKLTAILVSDPTTDKVNSAQKGQKQLDCYVILRGLALNA